MAQVFNFSSTYVTQDEILLTLLQQQQWVRFFFFPTNYCTLSLFSIKHTCTNRQGACAHVKIKTFTVTSSCKSLSSEVRHRLYRMLLKVSCASSLHLNSLNVELFTTRTVHHLEEPGLYFLEIDLTFELFKSRVFPLYSGECSHHGHVVPFSPLHLFFFFRSSKRLL